MWGRLYVWSTAGVAGLFGLVMLARQLGWPIPPKWWDDNTGIVLPGLFLVGGLGIVSTVLNAVVLGEKLRKNQRLGLVETYCHALLIDVEDAAGHAIPVISLAVHVWTPGRTGYPLARQEELIRYATYRLSRRMSSSVSWTKGKGAVGQCWLRHRALVADLSPLHVAAAAGRATFEGLSDDDRWGITWDEFEETKPYWSIYVSPLKDTSGNFIGCVSVDCTAPNSYPLLNAAAENTTVETTISLIRDALLD